MPRRSANPFDFEINSEKQLAKATLQNYKARLNHLTAVSVLEHETNKDKPIIKTKQDLLDHTDHVLFLLRDHTEKRLTKTATLAAIFYITGRLSEDHPFVKEFRDLYYTDKYKKSLEEKKSQTLIESAKEV